MLRLLRTALGRLWYFVQGIVVRKNNSAFLREWVDQLAGSVYPLSDSPAPKFLYVCIDPSGGGASDMAMTASFFTPVGGVVIVGCDYASTTTDEAQENLVQGFISRLRERPTLRNTRIVVICERNYGGTVLAHRIATICASFKPISSFSADTDAKLRRIGVVLTEDVKDRYRDNLAMALRTGTVFLSTPFVSTRHADEAKAMLVAQIRAYRFDLVPRKVHGVEAPPRKKWGGKTAGMSDDLAITTQMALFWPGVHQHEGDKCLVDC